MQASRAIPAIRAIRTIQIQTRNLHMTGPATFSSILTSDKPSGASRGPAISATPISKSSETKPARHFNTSRSLKAVNDTSTIDFAYLPDFDPDTQSAPVQIRMPMILSTASARVAEAEEPVMVPTVHTVTANTHIHAPSAMFDMADHIDFQSMAAQVAKLSKPVEESAGMVRQLWSGFVDDVFGPKSTPSKA